MSIRTKIHSPRIDSLKPGDMVVLIFSHHAREETYERAIFLGIKGEGDDRHAKFLMRDRAAGTYEWEAYRFNGRWVYGSSADRLSLYSIIETLDEES